MSVASLLNKTCSVYAKTMSVSATSGGNVFSFPSSATYTGVACTLQYAGGGNDDRWLREGHRQGATLFVSWDDRAKVNEGDRVRVDVGETASLDFSVTSKFQDDAGRQAYARYSLEFFDPNGVGGGMR